MKLHELLLSAANIAQMPTQEKRHFLNPNAIRLNRSLGDAVGLKNIGVHLITVAPGHDSTEYHKHHYEEECVYVLSGSGCLNINGTSYPFSAGDFVGFPANTAAHTIHNNGTEALICLVMGQRLVQDVCDYPLQNKRLYRHSGSWNVCDLNNLSDPRSK